MVNQAYASSHKSTHLASCPFVVILCMVTLMKTDRRHWCSSNVCITPCTNTPVALTVRFLLMVDLHTVLQRQTLPECLSLGCLHTSVVSCRRKTTVKTLCIYADYKSDESYTPSKISVRVGNNFHNLQEIRVGQ